MQDNSRCNRLKRLKRVEVSSTFLAEMLKSGGRRSTDLPEDASFVRMYPSIKRDSYWIVLQSSEWNEIAEGARIPVEEITVKQCE